MGEKNKVAIRNIIREANEDLKKKLKGKLYLKMKTKTLKKYTKRSQNIENIEKILIEKERDYTDMNKLNHIAFIMDGNGRWGEKKRVEIMVTLKALRQ